MRRMIAAPVVVALVLALTAPAAHAGGTTASVALGLASFAVFNQLVAPFFYPRPVYAYPPVYVTAPPAQVVYAAPSPVVMAPPAPPAVVHYPHGRYELRTNGGQYTWVWIPNAPPPVYAPPSAYAAPPTAPPPAAACKPTGKYVKTPQGFLPECE